MGIFVSEFLRIKIAVLLLYTHGESYPMNLRRDNQPKTSTAN